MSKLATSVHLGIMELLSMCQTNPILVTISAIYGLIAKIDHTTFLVAGFNSPTVQVEMVAGDGFEPTTFSL